MCVIVAWLAAAAWLGLLLFRGGYWRIEARPISEPPADWPSVVALIPARDEAAVVGDTVRSLLSQDYPGKFFVILVDDSSQDNTADAAREAAAAIGQAERLRVVAAQPLPEGWTGKMWAQSQAVADAELNHPDAELWLLSDADITHAPDELRRMVALLTSHKLDMASLMVRLSTSSFAERAMIPAFVYFFRMLYPFRWANSPDNKLAAAAGGYVLIRRDALSGIGGIAAIKDALIDDCALAAAVKTSGRRIWLGLTRQTVSQRVYPGLVGLWMMIARSAYTQLRYSPLLLAGTVLAMSIGFLAPPLLTLAGGKAALPAFLAWLAMSLSYIPMLEFYGMSLLWAPLLPLVAFIYMGATIDSARRHWLGRGGVWKGRAQAPSHQRKTK